MDVAVDCCGGAVEGPGAVSSEACTATALLGGRSGRGDRGTVGSTAVVTSTSSSTASGVCTAVSHCAERLSITGGALAGPLCFVFGSGLESSCSSPAGERTIEAIIWPREPRRRSNAGSLSQLRPLRVHCGEAWPQRSRWRLSLELQAKMYQIPRETGSRRTCNSPVCEIHSSQRDHSKPRNLFTICERKTRSFACSTCTAR